MAHEWTDNTKALSISEKLSVYGARRCINCGATQVKDAEHRWMRVTGYRWRPLVGRCKGTT